MSLPQMTVPPATLRERARYRFDTWMSKGTGAILTLLGIATLVFIVLLAMLVVLLGAYPSGAQDGDFWDIVWGNLMRTLDPGTMGADSGWAFRVLMLVATVGGLVVVASLIGIVSGAFDDKVVQLRQGRSQVIEQDHTLILGWNGQLFTIISELCQADASKKRSTVVVLADHDKVTMEEEIRSKVPDHRSTSIICRRGNPMSQLDLQMVSPTTARSIVVLSDDDDEHPDAGVIKTVMALAGHESGGDGPPIFAELQQPTNLTAARVAGRHRARWVLANELISRITVQTCLHRGLSVVCTELLDYAGDEIYFSSQPELVGATYLEAQFAFADSTVIGIARGEEILLNPSPGLVVGEGDQLIMIAQDDSAIRPATPGVADEDVLSTEAARPPSPDRTLVLGYNASLQQKLEDLASYLPPGSSIDVVADVADPAVRAPDGVTLQVTRADTTDRTVLDALDVSSYDHVLVLAYRGLLDVQAADARTIVTLLHLRDIADQTHRRLNIVSEMLDDRNRELAEVTKADDFIVSDRLTSLILSQVSQNRALIEVFEQLFSHGGSEVYLHPAELYIRRGAEADFYTVAAAAAARGETAIGFRIAADAYSRTKGYGIRLNPPKAQRRTFAPGDAVIVLAEDG